jgi:hypothetical protein
MEKQINGQKRKLKKGEVDKLLSIPGIGEAIEVVREQAWLRAQFEALIEAGEKDNLVVEGDSVDEWLEKLAPDAGPKIAELWNLSEDAGEKLAELIYWGKPSRLAERSYLLPFVLVTKTKDQEAARALGQKYYEFEQENAIVITPKGIRPGRIYLDVTYLPYSALHQAYKAIALCRRCLSIEKRDLQEGAPERIVTQKALKCVEPEYLSKSSKQSARALGFRIYTSDNPSGSYPLFRKYRQRGREIKAKLDALEDSLIEL